MSTAYYAMFHALAKDCADLLLGTGANASDGAWTHIYRSLEHGFAKNACTQASNLGFPHAIVTFADEFVSMQQARHSADYDPDVRYTRAEVLLLVSNAEQAIASLRSAPKKDRRAFAVQVLLRRRA